MLFECFSNSKMPERSTPDHNSPKRNPSDELKSSTLTPRTFNTVLITGLKHCYEHLCSTLRFVASVLQCLLEYFFFPLQWLWWIWWLARRRTPRELALTDISDNKMRDRQRKLVGFFQHQINIYGAIVETRPGHRHKYAVSTWVNKFCKVPNENLPHYLHPAYISQLMARQMSNAISSRRSVPGGFVVTHEINFHDPLAPATQTDNAFPMRQLRQSPELRQSPRRSRSSPVVAREDESTDDDMDSVL